MASQVTIEIIEDPRVFLGEVNIEMAKIINRNLQKIVSQIEKRVKKVASETLRASPEYESLTDTSGIENSLRTQFGFTPDMATRITDGIESIILDSLEIEANHLVGTYNGINGKWLLKMIPSSYLDLLSSEYASYTSIKKNVSAEEVPWLEWLLFYGDTTILADYEIKYGDYPGNVSRSRKAIMVPGDGWGIVPGRYTGTQNNNWLTRTFRNVRFIRFVELAIQRSFLEVLKI